MEQLSEQELKAGRVYRRALVGGLVVVAGLTAWFMWPTPKVDLRFLDGLNRTHIDRSSDGANWTIKQKLADVETILDKHLNRKTNWAKTGGSPYGTVYTHEGSKTLYIVLSSTYTLPTRPVKGRLRTAPVVADTNLTIHDPFELAILK